MKTKPIPPKGRILKDGQHPDPKNHLIMSFVKSGVRIVGYVLLFGISSPWAYVAASVLILSEVVGIVEELV